ncbi:hypothetical protein X975_02749, partial [Stegodyphus mimosarum]
SRFTEVMELKAQVMNIERRRMHA